MKTKEYFKQRELKNFRDIVDKNKASKAQRKKIRSLFDKILAYQTTGKLPRFD